MRLIGCHIENFGKLHDLTVTFSEDTTVIMQENGWGKSTLAAFIKVMFYGFANEKKRVDMLEKERVRFKPWHGGVYGGELEFEVNGKRYLLNRTFGSKEAEDAFALYDKATNLPTKDFSRDDNHNIGEELFRIDQESFQRTVFIAQNDCATGTTDSINAKMGNLADNLDDINNYEKVQKVLKELRNGMAPGRKTGALKKLKDEMDDLRNDLRKREVLEKSIAELENKLGECRSERALAVSELEKLQKEWTDATRYHEIRAKREHYEHILRQYEEQKAEVDDALAFFGGKAPDADRLQSVMRDRSAMLVQETEMQANALDGEEQAELSEMADRFADGLPEEELFERVRRLSDELETLQAEEARGSLSEEEIQESERLQRRLMGELREETIDHYLDRWNLRTEKKSGLGTKKATLASLRTLEENAEKNKKGKGGIWLFVLAGCVLAAGVLLCTVKPVAGVTALAAGIALLVAAFVLRAAGARKQRERKAQPEESGASKLEREIAEDEAAVEQATDEVMHFLDELGITCGEEDRGVRDVLYELKDDVRRRQRLEAKRQDYEKKGYGEKIRLVQTEINSALTPYYEAHELRERRVYELVSDLEKWKKEYIRLTGKEKKYRQAKETFRKLEMSVREFLLERGRENEADIDVYLQYLSKRLAAYEADRKDLEGIGRERLAFEQNNDVQSLENDLVPEPRDTELIEQEQETCRGHLQEIEESMRSYGVQLDGRQAEMEELELQQERLAGLEEQYAKDNRYYQNLGVTAEYLAKAKESFSAKYMGPILSAFRKYYALMTGTPGEEFWMDANIQLTKKEEGEQRDTRAFSAGNQDLIGIALRMALVDAMYRDEKPFLIFDDSFTNMDDEKLERAKAFLKEVAKEYQVIYFTCHGSRRV